MRAQSTWSRYFTGDVGGSVRMKKAKNSTACASGERKISATCAGSAAKAVTVKSAKYDPRKTITSGILFTRSVMKMPVAKSTTMAAGCTSGSAPHQLCPVSKTREVATIASAAGLKTLALRPRRTYLLATATSDVTVVTYHGSCGLSTIATNIAER